MVNPQVGGVVAFHVIARMGKVLVQVKGEEIFLSQELSLRGGGDESF